MKSLLLAGAAIIGLAGAANAAQIPAGSVLNIVGSANFNATTVTTSTPAGLTTNTGQFTALPPCLSCVTVNMPNYVYAPIPATGLLFTANTSPPSATIATVTLNAGVTAQSPVTGVLDIEDKNATLTLTGFSATPGNFFWTINEVSGAEIGSFSVTAAATPTPEPASLALLGVGLLGLGAASVRRKR